MFHYNYLLKLVLKNTQHQTPENETKLVQND